MTTATIEPSIETTLPQLAEPENYVACRWDLVAAAEPRAYWIGLFRRHFTSLLDQAIRVAEHDGEDLDDARRRAEQARQEFNTYLDIVTAEPARYGRLDVLEICLERERVLRRARFADPYRLVKERENAAALALLPGVLAELDALDDETRAVALIRGVFAGNIFDLGATATNALFLNANVDFCATRDRLKPRPWLVDDLDAWLERLSTRPYREVVMFVDNAGPDIALGMLPLARDLVRRGARVALATNSGPSLNDVVYGEVVDLLRRAGEVDAVIRGAVAEERLSVLADGNGVPLIDLTRLAPEFVREMQGREVDLIVLEGMGRGLESNYDARFTCDSLKIAMIKDEGVAAALGGTLYDLVCKFERGI